MVILQILFIIEYTLSFFKPTNCRGLKMESNNSNCFKGIQSDKQSITEYINEQKELFLLEYAVKTKQRTIAKLEEMISEEERRAKLAETKLEEDAIAFDEFLKENDRRSVDALKRLDTLCCTSLKYDCLLAYKLSSFHVCSEIANSEDNLRLYLSYEAFLLSVSPKEWQEQQMAKKKLLKKDKRDVSKSLLSFPAREKSRMGSTSFILHQKISKYVILVLSTRNLYCMLYKSLQFPLFSILPEWKLRNNEPEIYFKDPDELLQMYRHLEEQNLSLFQNIQDLSGTLEDARQREHAIVQGMEKRINDIVNEKKALTAARLKEEQKSAELELKIKVFSSGDYNPISMDKSLNTLKKKITEVYRACCGTIEVSSMTAFQMLKAIEIRVSELCEMLEILPPEYLETVETMEKLRAKQRRQRVREDKLKELKRIQEERLKHALERAIAVPKTRVGRKLVFRSQPPEAKQKGVQVVDLTTKSEDDYYFC
uniref:Coiled-coil domain containing 38 n=1 Tax=Podarcis muralis TaxID=64176 RepID=A0A670IW03_PODMU